MGDPATPTAKERAETRALAATIVKRVRADERMPLHAPVVVCSIDGYPAEVCMRGDVESLVMQLAQEIDLLAADLRRERDMSAQLLRLMPED